MAKTATIQRGVPRISAGVEYSSFPGCNRVLFRCDRLSARLSVNACAENHLTAVATDQGLPGYRLAKCRGCPIGADHAGYDIVVFSKLFGTSICPRCGKGTTRMIQGRICVSCRNREYELLKGKNAKGTAPVNLRPLVPFALHYAVDGRPARYRTSLCTGTQEAVVQVLRRTKGRVVFGWHGDQSHMRQGRLL